MKFLVFFFALFVASSLASSFMEFSIKVNNDKTLNLIPNVVDHSALAFGSCDNASIFTTGWNKFYIKTNSAYPDELQMQAAGFAEGFCFYNQTYTHFSNVDWWFRHHYVPNGTWPQAVNDYLLDNFMYIRSQVQAHRSTSDYWRVVGLVLEQFYGFVAGYQRYAPQELALSEMQLYFYQSLGDLLDLVKAVAPHLRPDYANMTPDELLTRTLADDHCSGLTRLVDGNRDLLISQVAWFATSAMNRVMKQLHIPLNDKAVKAKKLSFSSYPGFVYSFDDFMLSDQGLVHIETTNQIFDTKLYEKCSFRSVLTWTRNRVAMMMADSTQEWFNVFKQQNSGSYNNQWQIVDFKLFTPGEKLKPGTFFVAEQIPGEVMGEDMTHVLETMRYFPSFNIPYFKHIFNVSGYPSAVKKNGDFWTWEHCPRANIFRRDTDGINSIAEMMGVMRMNYWQHDPLSLGDPGNAIASRYDLKPAGQPRREPFGALDAKITTYEHAKHMRIFAISSPTYVQQPVFCFSTTPFEFQHWGLPDCWDFPWVTVEWPDSF
eukprot:GCRY01000585.1.p1 GENE.GCRY01000585.1~~GCRY01000585.1.p1  ORF type:complete len:543 (+),score=106.29 GCRY01000585.1:59-1687(+)